MRIPILAAVMGAVLSVAHPVFAADDHKVIVAYQTGAVPYLVGIANGALAQKTGWTIEFRRFDSGADIFAAMASGDVQIGDVGSSPFAAAVSRGFDVKAIYITAGAGEDEALVVRPEIKSLADLKGKRLAAAPVSTDHYMLLATLKQAGLTEKDAQVIAIPQPEIVAAWKRGDIDGGFVWDPALSALKQNGHVLIDARHVAENGAPTFGALVANASFAKQNPEFVTQYVHVVDGYYKSLHDDPKAWDETSDNIKVIAGLQGGTPKENADRLKGAVLIPLEEQTTDKWLAGGDRSGVAKVLANTAQFLKDQKKITRVLDSYAGFTAPQVAAASLKLTN